MKTLSTLFLAISCLSGSAHAENGYGSHGRPSPFTFNIANIQGIGMGKLDVLALSTSEHPVLRFTCAWDNEEDCVFFTEKTQFVVIQPFKTIDVTF